MRRYNDIWAMIGKLPLEGMTVDELKRVIVSSVSKGRTDSLRELTGGELERLRTELRYRTGSKPRKSDGEKRRKRSQVLKQLERYGVDTKNWDAVNAFVEEERIAGKAFAMLSMDELEKLRRKMHAINRKRMRKKSKDLDAGMEQATTNSGRRNTVYRLSASLNNYVTKAKYN